MGLLIDGKWSNAWYETEAHGGRFVRPDTQFRGQLGSAEHPAEAGRYHLYVSYACPWAHRTLIVRVLKRLQGAIDVSVVHPLMLDQGWKFEASFPGATEDHALGKRFLHQVYTHHDAKYSGRVTVPVLLDKVKSSIVSNESADILRALGRAFDGTGVGDAELDLYPEALRGEIDSLNERIYPAVNNGVYRAGFATSQEAYEEAFDELFATLDFLDERLASRRYLVGGRLTEADIRLFTTLVRFDAVYFGHFKCNLRRIADYPALSAYVRDIHQLPGVGETVRLDHIKEHYYASHRGINPTGIVPKGPALDFSAPHGRESLG